MSWEDLTDVDKAWIAGIFEGEGCISIHSVKYIRISIYNNDLTMLTEIQNMIGDDVYVHERKHKRKDSWAISHQLQIQKRSTIMSFLEHIYPFVRSEYKRNQISSTVNTAIESGGNYA